MPCLKIPGGRLANMEFHMCVRKEGSWGGKDTFSFNRWWEWASRRLVLLISKFCLFHIWEHKVIWVPAALSSLSSPTLWVAAPACHDSLFSAPPKPRPCDWEPPSKGYFWMGKQNLPPLVGGSQGGRDGWESSTGQHAVLQNRWFCLFFSISFTKLYPFLKQPQDSSTSIGTVRWHLIKIQKFKQLTSRWSSRNHRKVNIQAATAIWLLSNWEDRTGDRHVPAQPLTLFTQGRAGRQEQASPEGLGPQGSRMHNSSPYLKWSWVSLGYFMGELWF